MILTTIAAIFFLIANANVNFTLLPSPNFYVPGIYYTPDESLPHVVKIASNLTYQRLRSIYVGQGNAEGNSNDFVVIGL